MLLCLLHGPFQCAHTHTHRLVWVLEGVVHDGHQSQPSLLGGGDDLIGRQDEAVAAGVPQLEGVGVLDALVVGPVNGAPAGLICKGKRGLFRLFLSRDGDFFTFILDYCRK